MSELNNRQWNMMHKRKRHQPVYPAESVIRFVSGIRKEDDDPTRILDAGCGAGRHVIMISKEAADPSFRPGGRQAPVSRGNGPSAGIDCR